MEEVIKVSKKKLIAVVLIVAVLMVVFASESIHKKVINEVYFYQVRTGQVNEGKVHNRMTNPITDEVSEIIKE